MKINLFRPKLFLNQNVSVVNAANNINTFLNPIYRTKLVRSFIYFKWTRLSFYVLKHVY